ncbi:MAG: hypothetical protein WC371_05250 [Parachlamydiales bacterium]|jgi:hypothetical protein
MRPFFVAFFSKALDPLIKYRYPVAAFFILPPLFLMVYFFSKLAEIQTANQRLLALRSLFQQQQKEKQSWQKLLDQYRQADPFFLQNTLEKLTFLEKERLQMEKLCQDPAFQTADKKLPWLKNSFAAAKGLKFKQLSLKNGAGYKESEEALEEKIELNSEDLEKLLSLIENVPIGPFVPSLKTPQLLIKQFVLSKTEQETFKVHLNLYKRDFSK